MSALGQKQPLGEVRFAPGLDSRGYLLTQAIN